MDESRMICLRDMWLGRLKGLFDGGKDEYNRKYVFAVGGGLWCGAGRVEDTLDPEAWTEKALSALDAAWAENADKLESANRFAPVGLTYDIFGVHFIDRILGAHVYYRKDDQDPSRGGWYADYLSTPVGRLEMPDMDKNETWLLAKRAAMAFAASGRKGLLFSTPVLSSPLNIFINLYGQEGLLAMMEDEKAARHDLRVIADVIEWAHRFFRSVIPADQLQGTCADGRVQPVGYGQICGCTTQLISGSLYEQFIAPLDDEILGIHPHGGMIHLCGVHTQHIPVFRQMKHLRSIQVNDRASWDTPAYFEGLRDDQMIYFCSCPEITMPDAIRATGGDRLVLVGGINGAAPEKD